MSAAGIRTGNRAGVLALAVVAATVAALVVTYVSLGGGSYKPLELADPCKPRPLPRAEGFEAVSQQLLLSALDGAACRLRVPREELALALADADSRQRFAREHRISEATLEEAIRDGLARAVADAERANRLSGGEASILRGAVEALPIGALIDALRTGEGLTSGIGELLRR